jgi:hypothetical protein
MDGGLHSSFFLAPFFQFSPRVNNNGQSDHPKWSIIFEDRFSRPPGKLLLHQRLSHKHTTSKRSLTQFSCQQQLLPKAISKPQG